MSRIFELFIVDPEAGTFVYKTKTRNGRGYPGKRAGSICNGYRMIAIDGQLFYEHRLIWYVVHGNWPSEIDHINGKKSDNRLANLRVVTRSQQMANVGPKKTNRFGVTGVGFEKRRNKFRVMLMKNRKVYWFGYFDKLADATEVALKERKRLFGEFAA